ncbi:DUF6090 family protein [Algoriphagus mannitolivorans]|uniref:DUF6090 family protein n=1 Tax=Algoriphagus mannitolivorans TaxID=226504 RepID=UPI00040C0E83|nr:DUF6090 family protein [Algoriphagus mannitolivorans]
MVSFFRKIRQKLLQQNRVTRYLAYAVGEIFLVVIGILIAIQINNSNESKKLRKKEIILLTQMRDNLKFDQQDLEYNLSGNTARIKSNQIVLDALQENQGFHDSLKFHFGNILGNYQLSENTGAWENLKSVGLDLISSDSLRNSISYLYSTRYVYLENLEKGLDDRYQWDFVYPQVLKNLTIDTLWISCEPTNFQELSQNQEFKEVLKMNILFRGFMQTQYEELHTYVGDLVQKIEFHLDQLED